MSLKAGEGVACMPRGEKKKKVEDGVQKGRVKLAINPPRLKKINLSSLERED